MAFEPRNQNRPGSGGPGSGRGRSDRGGRGRGDDGDNRYEERVVKINRCATVVKGGRRFSFSALVVLGDRSGQVGFGFGKANEVPPSVEKAIKDAKKNMVKIILKGSTIPHESMGIYRSSKVFMAPAADGTGVIAGSAVRAVVECVGVKNILTKVYGSTNPLNVVKAAMNCLQSLRNREDVLRLRGVSLQ
jgi:small subunit ribosomal protein S5